MKWFVVSYDQSHFTRFTTPRIRGLILSGALLLLFSAFAYPAYRGSPVSFLLFDLSFVAMLLLALPQPRSYSYVFFAIMLFLGFWSKLMLHMLSGADFIEPIGSFSAEPVAWDRALDVASVAAIGISVARVIHLAWGARAGSWNVASAVPLPSWYPGWRRTIWIASLLAMFGLNLLNFQVAFYQTGVNPRLILPLHLNVASGWLISIGFALWFAVLIHWEFQSSPRSLARTLVFPIIESLVSSTFALSRSFYLLHSIPYFFAVAASWTKFRTALSRRTLVGLLVSWALCFAISLALASWFRMNIYYLAYEPALVNVPGQTEIVATPTPGATTSNQITGSLHQVSKLFVDRWIGLEGVMAVSSYRSLGFGLLSESLRGPKQGNTSLYQVISNSGYGINERFTFGTLPGIVGVLFYSGSYLVVGVGVMLITLLMIGTELAALRFTANAFFVLIVALGMANVTCQVQFPYLAGVYIAQLWVATVFVWVLCKAPEWLRRRRSQVIPQA